MLLKLLKRKIIQTFLTTIFYVISLKSIIVSFLKIRILKQHLACETFGLEINKESTKYLILAIYPRVELLPSIRRFIQFSIKQDFYPIIVMNKSKHTEFYLKNLLDHPADFTIITRKNLGRDFGAYQCGSLYLHNKVGFAKIEKIAFFNDSMIYGKDFTWFSQLTRMNSDISSLYANFELGPHFQSMAFICNSKAILSPVFLNFWRNYYPTEIRKRVISRGELALSKSLLREDLLFGDLATELLSTETKKMTNIENQALIMFALDLLPQKNLFATILKTPDFPLKENLNLSSEMQQNLINLVVTSCNLSHAMGNYFSRNYNFPIKMDLLKFGTAGILDLQRLLTEMCIDQDEIQKLLFLYRYGGSFYSTKGWQKLFREYNVI